MSKTRFLSNAEFMTRNACMKVYDTDDTCNQEVIYIFCNTWLALCKSYSQKCYELVYTQIIERGLVGAIDWGKDIADHILNEDGHIPLMSLQDLDLEAALEVLLFGSRLTLNVDGAGTDDIITLLKVNTTMKLLDRCDDSLGYHPEWNYFSSDVKSLLKRMLRGYQPLEKVRDISNPILTNGASSDASKPKAHKLMRCEAQLTPVWGNFWLTEEQMTVTPTTVPKNYKKRRVIAPESVASQERMGCIDNQLRLALEKNCNGRRGLPIIVFDDQEGNRDAALQGSKNGDYATIDLTSASDTNRVSQLVYYPKCICDDVRNTRSKWIKVDGRRKTSYIVSTAGSRLTFPMETAWFAALAQVATNYSQVFYQEKLLPARSFGDDIVVDSRALDLTLHLLDLFGHVVNPEKSFWTGGLREACGTLGYKGLDLKRYLWPRHDYSRDWDKSVKQWFPEGIASFIEMQHRFYHHYEVRLFLTAYIKEASPKMTSHTPFVPCDDLWSEVPFYHDGAAPHDGDLPVEYTERGGIAYREGHLKLVSKPSKFECCKKPCCFNTSKKAVIDNYYKYIYEQYLRFGPLYDSELDRLLGITTSRVNTSDLATPRNTWKLSYE